MDAPAPQSLASLLANRGPLLIGQWVERVHAQIDDGAHSNVELRDHIPYVVKELIDALQTGACPPRRDRLEAPSVHVRQRFRIDFDIDQVLEEYALLHGVILDAAGTEATVVTITDIRVLLDFFSRAAAEGVSEYQREALRDTSLERATSGDALKELVRVAELARADAEAERAKVHALLEQAPVAICITEGSDHVFTFANAEYRKLFPHRELVGKRLREALPAAEALPFERIFDDVMIRGASYIDEVQPLLLGTSESGRASRFSSVIAPKRNGSGVVDGVMQCSVDVTDQLEDRERVEELARQARDREAELRISTDALPVLLSFVDADEKYRFVNKAYERWFGISVDKLRGCTVRDVVGEEAYALLAPYVVRGLAGESFDFEQYAIPYRHGRARDIHVSFRPYIDGAGQRNGYIVLVDDITARRRADLEREALALQGAEVLEAMGDAFFAVDRDWTVLLVNHQFERQSGRSRDAIVGSNFWELFAELDPESQHFAGYHRCMAERAPVQFVDYFAPIDLWTEIRAFPTHAGGISVFFRDVSQQKRAEKALLSQAELEQQLLGIASHDLRNPLNVIGLASSILESAEGLTDAQRTVVARIKRAADRATAMVRDLLDFTQARLGGGIRIERRSVELHKVVTPVVEEVAEAHPAREIVYEHEGHDAGSWDPARLGQVVQNLVSNAIKYSAEDTRVVVRSSASAGAVTLSVHNDGKPIAPHQLAAIFEPFQRAGALEQASRSVGLGLYIVREVVSAHGGTVGVTSTERDGTTFTVTLPRGV